MATLYEIDRAIMECVDGDTGEIIDPARMDALQMARDEKIQNVALWIKNLESDAAAYKNEKDAFAAREKSAANKAAQLKQWLSMALGGEKFTTSKCAVSFRRSESVEIVDENAIPREWMTKKTTYTPDKTAIKMQLKSGAEIPGCCLVEKINTQIK